MPRTTFVPNGTRIADRDRAYVIDMTGDVNMLGCRGQCGMFVLSPLAREVGYTCPDCHPLPEDEN